ncbi:methyl-accepting chemotaxis protein [Vibrio sp. SM6]|uniref:Methyl-accepting chemotaxis protein n=1 Tax=Vibrio agarilyticus TaxID=2726741 RepID=A0A7X8TPS3_9VIBR|nr:methyl-accepting chemotaxis protein [Vibrio agarilyticus]NLS11983.1 methyl-accepting chemotaxis protein [Vibrio agarilyticus]
MRTLSVQWKITVLAGCCLVFTSLALIGFSLYNAISNQNSIRQLSTQSVTEKSQQLLETRAEMNARDVKDYFDEAIYRAEMLIANSLFQKKNTEDNFGSSEELRAALDQMIYKTVSDFPSIQGAYLVFQPNALDSEDGNYIGADYVGSNDVGQFATYWRVSHDSNAIEQFILSRAELEDTANAEKFICPITQGEACVSTPKLYSVDGKPQLMSSLTLPIVNDETVIGFLGLDLRLTDLSFTVAESDANLFNGRGHVNIISRNETVIASDDINVAAGERFVSPVLSRATISDLIVSEQAQAKWSVDGKWLSVFSPVIIADQTWGIFFDMPRQAVLDDAIALDNVITNQLRQGAIVEVMTGSVFVIAGLLIIALMSARIVKPIRLVVRRLEDIASGEGDLTQRLEVRSEDEIGQLAQQFNAFLSKLQQTITQVVENTAQIASTAAKSNTNAMTTRKSSEAQFREVDMVSTASEEMTQTAALVVQNAQIAVQAAEQANQSASQGQEVIETSAAEMIMLVQQMKSTVPVVEELAKNNSNITEILGVIEGISEQTNLLALNAAIEAARAGEQGRGFAVVADEVRKLASRTHDSIEEIQQVIQQLEKGTQDVVSAIGQSSNLADSTANHVQQAVASLSKVFESIASITDMNMQIVKAAQEQQSVSSEVNQNVTNIRELSSSILDQATDAERMVQDIDRHSTTQQALMRQFKV